ncbi:MAG: hypothetical protein HQ582_08335 [Planctomycetes bacterium]|nr:hypothetical protein [Planctomycetota bacterium]
MAKSKPKAPSQAATTGKKCVDCALPIPANAKVCTKCNGYQQGWRRYVRFSDTVLALLIALISVLAVAIPNMLRLFENPKTEIKACLIGSEQVSSTFIVNVWVTNIGERPGFIKGVSITSKEGSANGPVPGEYPNGHMHPGESREFRLTFDPAQGRPEEEIEEGAITLIAITYDSKVLRVPVELSTD